MVGPGGLLVSHVLFDSRRPLQAGVHDDDPYLRQVLESVWGEETPRPSVSDWYYGENTLWATGWLLWSQLIRHRVTGEDQALTLARKCFADISHVFDMSRERDPGVLGKPHGGRPGQTLSFDQSANPILFYLEFAQAHGSPGEVETARRNLLDYARLMIRRDWVVNLHGHRKRIFGPAHTSSTKIIAAVHAGSVLSGDQTIRAECAKQLRKIVDDGLLPWPSRKYEVNTNTMYYARLGEYWHDHGLADLADWHGMIGEYWAAATAALDAERLVLDGTYDTLTRAFTPKQRGWSQAPPATAGGDTSRRWWHSPTSFAGRTLFTAAAAVIGLMARRHGHDDHAHHTVAAILDRLGPDTLRQFWPDPTTPDDYRLATNLFAPELPALWLVAYWMGREQDVW
jgi:hypothetical protein